MSNLSQASLADFTQLLYGHKKPVLTGQLKAKPEDFLVEELTNEALSGDGEHLWCWVEKRSENTDWVAGVLAKWASTSKKNVGFAGQKDRHAVTRQWFSIQLPGKADPDPSLLSDESVTILKMQRHNKKLQRGGLLGNRFEITLRHVKFMKDSLGLRDTALINAIQENLKERFDLIETFGVPNYFGEQRFGKQGNNLRQGEKLLTGSRLADSRKRSKRQKGGRKNQDSLYVSAIRSWMFNELLSQRIKAQNWNTVIEGDVLLDSKSQLSIVDDREVLKGLQKDGDTPSCYVTGGLFGDGPLMSTKQAYEFENNVMQTYQAWCNGLANNRIKPDRRSLVLMPEGLSWELANDENGGDDFTLKVTFSLKAGSFATMVLRELVSVYELR